MAENYLRLIQALFRKQTIPWLSHAMHPRARCGNEVCASTRPGLFRAKDWLDWCRRTTVGTLRKQPA